MKKKIMAALTAGLIAFGGFSFNFADAATRDEIAAIQVKRDKDFKYWTKNSVPQQKLVEFVLVVIRDESFVVNRRERRPS